MRWLALLVLVSNLTFGSLQAEDLLPPTPDTAALDLLSPAVVTTYTQGIINEMIEIKQKVIAKKSYNFGQAVTMLAPMSDFMDATWDSVREENKEADFKQALIDLALILAADKFSGNSSQRRELQDLMTDASEGMLSSFENTQKDALKKVLVDFKITAGEPENFEEMMSFLDNRLSELKAPDPLFLKKIEKLVVNRLDDDEAQIVDEGGEVILFASVYKKVDQESSWNDLRVFVEQVCFSQHFKNFKGRIATDFGGNVTGIEDFKAYLRGTFSSGIAIADWIASIERIAAVEEFTQKQADRFLMRVQYIERMIDERIASISADQGLAIRRAIRMVIHSRLKDETFGDVVALEELIKRFGGDEFANPEAPLHGSRVLLMWNVQDGSAPTTRFVKRVKVGPTKILLQAVDDDPVDSKTHFDVYAKADSLGFGVADGGPLDQGMMTVRANSGGMSSAKDTASVIEIVTMGSGNNKNFKAKSLTKECSFKMEGPKAVAGFKSKKEKHGYMSVGSDGFVRTFNAQTGSASGTYEEDKLTFGPWETFQIIEVPREYIELGKARAFTSDENRLAVMRNVAKRISTEQTELAVQKRRVLTQELAKFVDEKLLVAVVDRSTFLTAMNGDIGRKTIQTYQFVEAAFKGHLASDPELAEIISKTKLSLSLPPESSKSLRVPSDGDVIALYAPSSDPNNPSAGKYVRVELETLPSGEKKFFLKADAKDPLDPQTHFKAKVLRELIAFQSEFASGGYIHVKKVNPEQAMAENWLDAAKLYGSRIVVSQISKAPGSAFWDEKNWGALFSAIDADDKQSVVLKSKSFEGGVKIGTTDEAVTDNYMRVFNADGKLGETSSSTGFITVGMSNIMLVPLKSFYIILGGTRRENDMGKKFDVCKGLLSQIKTPLDRELLFREIIEILNEVRKDKVSWNKFRANRDALQKLNDFLNTARMVFSENLDPVFPFINSIMNLMRATPVFSSAYIPEEGMVIALAWKDPGGERRYVTSVLTSEEEYVDAQGWQIPFDDVTGEEKMVTRLKIDSLSPLSRKTHFRVVRQGNSIALLSLESKGLVVGGQMDSWMTGWGKYLEFVGADEPEDFDIKRRVLRIGTSAQEKLLERPGLRMMNVIGNKKTASFKFHDVEGYLSVGASDKFIRLRNPLTFEPAGMLKGDTLEPSTWEQFEIINVTDYMLGLGDAIANQGLSGRLSRYLRYIDGAKTKFERQSLLWQVEQEINDITGAPDKWAAYETDPYAADFFTKIFTQFRNNRKFKVEFSKNIDEAENKLKSGLAAIANEYAPESGSTVAFLVKIGNEYRYLTAIESEYKIGKHILVASGNDPVDGGAHFKVLVREGYLGFQSVASGKNMMTPVLPDDADQWLQRKKDNETIVVLTGEEFRAGAASESFIFDEESTKYEALLRNKATNGFLFADTRDTAMLEEGQEKLRPVRTVNSETMKSIAGGTKLRIVPLGEFYTGLARARTMEDPSPAMEMLFGSVQFISNDAELKILVGEIIKFWDKMASSENPAMSQKFFSDAKLTSRFEELRKFMMDSFESPETLRPLKNLNIAAGEKGAAVKTFSEKTKEIVKALEELSPMDIFQFMMDIETLVSQRVLGIGLEDAVDAGGKPIKKFSYKDIVELGNVLAQQVYHNSVIVNSKQRTKTRELLEKLDVTKNPLRYDEWLSYLQFFANKEHLTGNQREHVVKVLETMATSSWMMLADSNNFDFEPLQNLIKKFKYNQFKADVDRVKKLDVPTTKLKYTLLSGSDFNTSIGASYTELVTHQAMEKDITESLERLIGKVEAWESRVKVDGDVVAEQVFAQTLMSYLEPIRDDLASGSSLLMGRLHKVMEEIGQRFSVDVPAMLQVSDDMQIGDAPALGGFGEMPAGF
ncbi:hypothetical protein HOD08_01215 [bacterium]|nr:hypothetical protein [bacterium]